FGPGRWNTKRKESPKRPPVAWEDEKVLSRKDVDTIGQTIEDALEGNPELKEHVSRKLADFADRRHAEERQKAAQSMGLMVLALVGTLFGGIGIGAAGMSVMRPAEYGDTVVVRSPDRTTDSTVGLPKSVETCGRADGTVGRPFHNTGQP